MTSKSKLVEGGIFTTNNCGEILITKYTSSINVEVKFINTGSVLKTQAASIRKGNVKDNMHPTANNIGFLGLGEFPATIQRRNTKHYETWRAMFRRCYSINLQKKQPTYKGCTVCDEWRNFQVFAKWFDDRMFDGCQLDKDIKIKGNKIYSPSTCSVVTKAENTLAAHEKEWRIKTPKGVTVTVVGLTEFCKDNALTQSSMSLVLNGKREHHKGFSLSV